MKKILKIRNLNCAHCATKIENKISKLKGVNECTLNFMTQKLIVDIDSENIINDIRKIIKKINTDFDLS